MNQKTTAEKKLWAKIHAIDTKALLKMDLVDFCALWDQANHEQRKSLAYILDHAALEQTIREVVREELAIAAKQ